MCFCIKKEPQCNQCSDTNSIQRLKQTQYSFFLLSSILKYNRSQNTFPSQLCPPSKNWGKAENWRSETTMILQSGSPLGMQTLHDKTIISQNNKSTSTLTKQLGLNWAWVGAHLAQAEKTNASHKPPTKLKATASQTRVPFSFPLLALGCFKYIGSIEKSTASQTRSRERPTRSIQSQPNAHFCSTSSSSFSFGLLQLDRSNQKIEGVRI